MHVAHDSAATTSQRHGDPGAKPLRSLRYAPSDSSSDRARPRLFGRAHRQSLPPSSWRIPLRCFPHLRGYFQTRPALHEAHILAVGRCATTGYQPYCSYSVRVQANGIPHRRDHQRVYNVAARFGRPGLGSGGWFWSGSPRAASGNLYLGLLRWSLSLVRPSLEIPMFRGQSHASAAQAADTHGWWWSFVFSGRLQRMPGSRACSRAHRAPLDDAASGSADGDEQHFNSRRLAHAPSIVSCHHIRHTTVDPHQGQRYRCDQGLKQRATRIPSGRHSVR